MPDDLDEVDGSEGFWLELHQLENAVSSARLQPAK